MKATATSQNREFAARYTAAWCSQDAGSVAAFFSPRGSLTINGGVPAAGTAAITAAVQSFMTAFPDLLIVMDDVSEEGESVIYSWTLEGTNNGPGGAGNRVRVSGHEQWRMGADGLIAASLGHFDGADYKRQIEAGQGGAN